MGVAGENIHLREAHGRRPKVRQIEKAWPAGQAITASLDTNRARRQSCHTTSSAYRQGMKERIRSAPTGRSRLRLAAGAVVLSALAVSWLLYGLRAEPGNDHEAVVAGQARQRFEALCRGAGDERRNVAVSAEAGDGLAWLTPPLRLAGTGFSDRYRSADAYDRGCRFEECIARLLRVSFGAASNPDEASRHAKGFAYVEVLDPRDLELYRYRAGIGVARWRDAREIEQLLLASGEEPGPAVYDFVLQREAIEGYRARYGIRWDDTSTPDDQRLGIAGSALVLLDLKSGELIGRRTGYTLSWRAADAGTRATCPAFASVVPPGSADRDFILALLR